MIVIKEIIYKGRTYQGISDDTRLFSTKGKGKGEKSGANQNSSQNLAQDFDTDKLLLVKTKQNEGFFTQELCEGLERRGGAYAQACELGEILCHSTKPKPQAIGITGTNGKTTTAAMIYSLLLDLGYKVALLGTRGFFINDEVKKPKGLTTPCVLELYENLSLAQEAGCEYFVMEVSSHAIVQERIAGLSFALKILTNITSDHLDYHKSIEEYRAVKNSFFEGEGLKLLNADEPHAFCADREAFYYGVEKKGHLGVDVYALECGIDAHISWKYRHNGAWESEGAALSTQLYGRHNLYNALAAIAAVKILTQKPLEGIAAAMGDFGGVSGRMEVVFQKPLVIVDFAHTHDGMQQIFESFSKQKIVALFGAGGDRDRSKRPKMGEMAQRYAHRIYITSDNPRSESPRAIIEDILSGIRQDRGAKGQVIEVYEDRKEAILAALSSLQEDEVLLILGKGDEDYQIIGEKKIHFDDREIVRDYFESKA